MLISLTPIDGDGSVNTEDVTSVETVGGGSAGPLTARIWVRGHAGYGTYAKDVRVSTEVVQQYLSDPRGYLKRKHLSSIAAVLKSIEGALEEEPKEDWLESLSDARDCLTDVYDELENS